jgi:signal peptidase I
MTHESHRLGSFCRIYSALLYAYPPEFRRQFGGEMKQVFRDRCRDLAQSPGSPPLFRFALQVIADWLRSTVRERAAAIWSAGRRSEKRSPVTQWACAILIYLFATTALVQAYVIPSGSMERSLLVGDHLLVDRLAFSAPGPISRMGIPLREVKRGDIVAFRYPEDVRQTYIKRVIGLPGDQIRLENRQVVRNGRKLIEPYTEHIASAGDPYRDDFPLAPEAFTTPRGRDMLEHHVVNREVVVPPGMLFVLGDNRDNSADSRYWGFVPRSEVIGKPLLIYSSYDAPPADFQGWSFDHALDVAEHFLTRTRWSRTLLVPRSEPALETATAQ